MLPDTASASQDPSQPAPAVNRPTAVDNVEPPQPSSLPGKRATRHWEAWTHQEEENFFVALRQVGKNFEKITSRVQSKNKDQVRHYYYRLIKRMNKLLGPGFVLDAKNSKDVNSAMLRWWSLLEKHSCPASKLHLKPRRFKNFVTALEHQLLKDRRKATKKRAPPAESLATAAAIAGPVSGKSISESLKVVAAGESRPQKTASARASAGKRKVEPRSNRSKGEPSRPPRQRKKASDCNLSAAAYKRWEKAASAGVTLVAEAAEQLERATVSEQPKPAELCQSRMKHCSTLVPGIQLIADKETRLAPLRVDAVAGDLNRVKDTKALAEVCNADQVVKLKLQLFPIDDFTRKSMEQDGLNPHLELTLKSRKAISSVLQHLTQKWGRASAASGELRLFPFNMQWKNFPSCQSWSCRDISISAEEVYALLGKPSVFRLKYGWMPYRIFQSSNAEPQQQPIMFISSGGIDATLSGLQCGKQSYRGTDAALHGGLQSGKESNAIHESVCVSPSSTNIPNVRLPQAGVGNISGAHSCDTDAWHEPVVRNGCDDATSKKLSTVPIESLALPTSTSSANSLSSNGAVKQNVSDRKALQSPQCLGGNLYNSLQLGAASGPLLLSGRGEADCITDQKGILSDKASSRGQEGSEQCCWLNEESNDGFTHRLWGIEDTSNDGILLPTEMDWVDSLTNISVGELLNDASRAEHNQLDTTQAQQTMQSLDSFDAAVAAQGANLFKAGSGPLHQSQTSVWDGEDTCDGFSFQKLVSQKRESTSSSSALEHLSCQEIQKDSTGLTVVLSDFGSLEAWKQSFSEMEIQCQELKGDSGPQLPQQNVEGFGGKHFSCQEFYWGDSLGSLDLGVPASGCVQGQDLLLSGDLSLGNLGGYSLDVFQGCSSQGHEQRVLSTSSFQMQSTCTKGVCNGSLQESATVRNGSMSTC